MARARTFSAVIFPTYLLFLLRVITLTSDTGKG
jgi:hypothetical protein